MFLQNNFIFGSFMFFFYHAHHLFSVCKVLFNYSFEKCNVSYQFCHINLNVETSAAFSRGAFDVKSSLLT